VCSQTSSPSSTRQRVSAGTPVYVFSLLNMTMGVCGCAPRRLQQRSAARPASSTVSHRRSSSSINSPRPFPIDASCSPLTLLDHFPLALLDCSPSTHLDRFPSSLLDLSQPAQYPRHVVTLVSQSNGASRSSRINLALPQTFDVLIRAFVGYGRRIRSYHAPARSRILSLLNTTPLAQYSRCFSIVPPRPFPTGPAS
jgi:hypothetical protein